MSYELGKVFSSYFDKSSQTTWLFDKLHAQEEKYDTLFLKRVFYIFDPAKSTKNTLISISFYIKALPIDLDSSILQGYRTISDIKNKYCEKAFYADGDSDDYLLAIISDLLVNNKFDSNGDAFFEKPITLKAQDKYSRNEGFGRTRSYYFVGVNFERTPYVLHLD